MDDDPSRTPGGSPLRTAIAIAVLAFLAGLAIMAWALTRWGPGRDLVSQNAPAATPPPAVPAPAIAPPALQAMAPATGLDMRIAELQTRIDRIDQRAALASGNAGRAEGLLIAFAARRAIDRGLALGYIEGQLRERFADTQPRAVATVIAAARQPVTLEQLQIGLAALGPSLVGGGPEESWWDGFTRGLSGLVVVRKAGTPSPNPADRLSRAEQLLQGRQVDAALAEVARLPGRDKAAAWMEAARRFNEANKALDIIEAAAIMMPTDLAVLPLPAPAAPAQRPQR